MDIKKAPATSFTLVAGAFCVPIRRREKEKGCLNNSPLPFYIGEKPHH